MYTEKDLVAIAKRENNTKRNYLVVNRMQAKHVPVNPQDTLELFRELAKVVRDNHADERLLLIGFAETATAIGAALATDLDAAGQDVWYMQTTREDIAGVEFLNFSEVHSHATKQCVVADDVDSIINEIDRIIFVEDEVTTGNTILNIINLLEERYDHKLQFAVASILNGMDEAAQKVYAGKDIPCHYLVKTNHGPYTEMADVFKGDGEYVLPAETTGEKAAAKDIVKHEVNEYANARRLVRGKEYLKACDGLWESIKERIFSENNKMLEDHSSVLVLGTEEFMYPAIYVGAKLAQQGKMVRCHATTRSPIVVSSEEEYPLHIRYQLQSLYEDGRVTFIYDLKKYDKVIILTDARPQEKGLNTLVNALLCAGNKSIEMVRWCDK